MDRIMDAIRSAIDKKASDIHLSAGDLPVLRINGELCKKGSLPLENQVIRDFIEEYAGPDILKDYEKYGEADFSRLIFQNRFRINIFKERGNNSAVLRLVNTVVPDIDNMGLPQILKLFSEKKSGLLLVTGPAGSGKSTTMAAIINEINKRDAKNIITLEDPVEYIFKNEKSLIKQREINQDTKSFAKGVRASLRQDPDVILIGEMRDLDTISAALTAAETGHFVISTLHTKSAIDSIDRIIDVFPPYQQQQIRTQLSMVLEGVISQKLLKNAENNGRVGAFEIMIANNAVRNLIREGRTFEIRNVIQTNLRTGMITMDRYIRDLYATGIIDSGTLAEHVVEEKLFIG